MYKLRCYLYCFSLWLAAYPVMAEEKIRLSGFGTLGLSHFTNPHSDYTYLTQTKGVGRSSALSLETDSNLGIQIDYPLTSKLDITLQALSHQQFDHTFNPEISLGFLAWKLNPQHKLRFGRTQNPTLLFSEFRTTHSGLPMIRIPKEVYSQAPSHYKDGFDWIYRHSLDHGWQGELTLGAGSWRLNFVDDGVAQGNLINLVWHITNQAYEFKFGYSTGNLAYSGTKINAAFNTLQQLRQYDIHDRLLMNYAHQHLLTTSGKYEDEDILLISEASMLQVDGLVGNRKGIYFLMGKKLSLSSMIYAAIATRRSDASTTSPTDLQGLSATQASALMNNLFSPLEREVTLNSQTLMIGWRKELSEMTTLKLQADIIQTGRNSNVVNADSISVYQHPDTDVLLSANLNFLF